MQIRSNATYLSSDQVYNVCKLDFLSKIEQKLKNRPDTPKVTNERVQCIIVEESTSIQWVDEVIYQAFVKYHS